MSISLKNRKNTMLRNGPSGPALIHHGSETCRVDALAGLVTISLCGWDTVTTRGKIGAFLWTQNIFDISIHRVKGTTVLSRKGFPDIELDARDAITIRLSDRVIIQGA